MRSINYEATHMQFIVKCIIKSVNIRHATFYRPSWFLLSLRLYTVYFNLLLSGVDLFTSGGFIRRQKVAAGLWLCFLHSYHLFNIVSSVAQIIQCKMAAGLLNSEWVRLW